MAESIYTAADFESPVPAGGSAETTGKPIVAQAAIAWKPEQDWEVTDVIVAAPKAHEVRVKVLASALCHTGT